MLILRNETLLSAGLTTTNEPVGSRYGPSGRDAVDGPGAECRAESGVERRSLPGAAAGREAGSEVTDERWSTAGESESMGEANSAARFESESESRSSLRRFFPDMGKERGRGGKEAGGRKRNLPSVN